MPASRRIRAVVGALTVLVAVLSIWPWLRPTETMLRVTFLDVGQGDAALIELPEGPRLLVDGGPGGARRFDVGERGLAPFLLNRPLAGDLGPRGEALVLERAGPVRAFALKVAHHGSRFSSTAPFLEQARPQLAVISVGARNPFRHPSPEVLARLEAAGARVYRTDRDGAVVLETDGRVLRVTAWGRGVTETWPLDPETLPERTPENSTAPG